MVKISNGLELPSYPKAALTAGRGGSALATLTVGKDGRVEETVVTGSRIDSECEASIRSTVQRWVFTPIRVARETGGSEPVRFRGSLTFTFDPASGIVTRGSGPQSSANGPTIERVRWSAASEAVATLTDIIDVRERRVFRKGHSEGVLNVPLEELSDRVDTEFSLASTIGVDCSRVESVTCDSAAEILQQAGKSVVAIY
jgi:TonB family protein